MIEAVVFDLDGVVVESEQAWDSVRRELVEEEGGRWSEDATEAMQGMSPTEWSRYMHSELEVDLDPEAISGRVVQRLADGYHRDLPLLPGATEAVRRMAARWPLGLASSSNREVIDLVLDLAEIAGCFEATVSSEEVDRGKPAPDVYLEAAKHLDIAPERCAAIEDSSNGLRSASAAGMVVVAVPNRGYPPDADALELADLTLDSLDELSVKRIEDLRS
ncbi:MAG: HAD family hydrolase [Solirubrobacteraceae bacterium]